MLDLSWTVHISMSLCSSQRFETRAKTLEARQVSRSIHCVQTLACKENLGYQKRVSNFTPYIPSNLLLCGEHASYKYRPSGGLSSIMFKLQL